MRRRHSKPTPSPANMDSTGKPGIGGVVGFDAPVIVNVLVIVWLVVVLSVTVWVSVAVFVTV